MRKLFFAVAMLLTLLPLLYAGNTFTVVNVSDDGAGSLRNAVSNAANGDTVRFSLPTYPDTIRLTTGQILINVHLTIIGLGDDSTVISGNGSSRIFRIGSGDTVNIQRLSLVQGMVADSGGAVYNSGVLTLRHCNLNHNTAAQSGGAILSKSALVVANSSLSENDATAGFGGAVFTSAGSLNISASEFFSNTALTGGGAIACKGPASFNTITVVNNAANAGGGIYSQNTATISNSNITSNDADAGDGGGLYNTGNAKVTGCTFENNSVDNAAFSGAAIFSNNILQVITTTINNNGAAGNGGGIANDGGYASVVNSTLSNNNSTTGEGGAIQSTGEFYISNSTISGNVANTDGGGIASSSDLTIERTTITGNQAGANGGGIYSSDSLQFHNTIIGGNESNGPGTDIYNSLGTPTSLGYNLISDVTSGGFTPASTDIAGTSAIPVDPQLGPLADNGGVLLTHLPLCNSPAINAGDSTGAPNSDQAGNPRVFGGAMDIGSVELQTEVVVIDAIIHNESATGAANGSIESVVTGGTLPYTYAWSTGSNQNTITGLTAGPYSLTVTDFNSCTDSAVFTISVPDGIQYIQAERISIYPNPVHDRFTIESAPAHVVVVDAAGKTTTLFPASTSGNLSQFNVQQLAAGNYWLQLTAGEKIFTGSFQKE